LVLGARARKNDGMPIVRLPTSVRCLGKNGNGRPATPIASASNIEYTVLVRNRFATRSMLLMTRRPSATTAGRVANDPSSRTSCATAREAELPEPMAIPISASFRASTSLTPSPVIATT
jgi:hypothetical protein